jgi:hypothetical protein
MPTAQEALDKRAALIVTESHAAKVNSLGVPGP